MANEIVKVDFHGAALDCIRDGARVWVSVRRVCDVLDLDTSTQHKKLRALAWATVGEFAMVAEDGKVRKQFFADLDTLRGWLFTIEAGKVRQSFRPTLLVYQRECVEALRQYFDPRPDDGARIDESRGLLRNNPAETALVKAMVQDARRKQGVHFRAIEGEMRRDYKIPSYGDLLIRDLETVKRRLRRYITGEVTFARLNPRRALPAHDPKQTELVYPHPPRPNN